MWAEWTVVARAVGAGVVMDAVPPGGPARIGAAAAVLVSAWDGPAVGEVQRAVAGLGAAGAVCDVWLVCSDPPPALRMDVLAAGGVGCLPRVPESRSVAHVARLARWHPGCLSTGPEGESRAAGAGGAGRAVWGVGAGVDARAEGVRRSTGTGDSRADPPRTRGAVGPESGSAGPRVRAGRPGWQAAVPAAVVGPHKQPDRPVRQERSPQGRPSVGGPRPHPETSSPWWTWPDLDAGEVLAVAAATHPGAVVARRALEVWAARRGRGVVVLRAHPTLPGCLVPDPGDGVVFGVEEEAEVRGSTAPISSQVAGSWPDLDSALRAAGSADGRGVALALGSPPPPVLGRVHPLVRWAAQSQAVAVVALPEAAEVEASARLIAALRAQGARDVRVWLAGGSVSPRLLHDLGSALGVRCTDLRL